MIYQLRRMGSSSRSAPKRRDPRHSVGDCQERCHLLEIFILPALIVLGSLLLGYLIIY